MSKNMLITHVLTAECAHYLTTGFGACAEVHGHSYKFEITYSGEAHGNPSVVVDFHMLKSDIGDEVLNKLDHHFLNELEAFKGVYPTAEAIAMYVYGLVKDILDRKIGFKEFTNGDFLKLESVKVWETPDFCVEYRG